MNAALVSLVVIASILNTVQSGSNAALHKALGRPMLSMIVVFSAALAASSVGWLLSGERLPSLSAAAQAPWWAWIGGIFGALYILSMMLAADKLGAALFMGVTVTLAVITSLAMDHFGVMGFEVHKAGLARWAGGGLMVTGLALIAKY